MRDRRHFTFNNRLPENLYEKLPRYDASSKDLIVLYPIFKPPKAGVDWTDTGEYVKSALWNMNAMLKNSDVIEKAIPVKLYIQRQLYEEIAKRLSSNGVTSDKCIIFDQPDTRDPNIYSDKPNLGFCLLPFIDERLSDYNRVWINDTDLFLCRNKENAGDTFFDMLAFANEAPQNKIGIAHIRTRDSIMGNWLTKFRKFRNNLPIWHKLAMEAIGKEFNVPTIWENVYGIFYNYAPKSITDDFKAFLNKAIDLLKDDESITSLYHMYHPEIFFSMESTFNLVEIDKDIRKAYKSEFYFSHLFLSTERYEFDWNQHIGVFE